jgi:hypothetical protein
MSFVRRQDENANDPAHPQDVRMIAAERSEIV